jgi:hypothetical protein
MPAQRMNANSHGSHATNITVLQSFCDEQIGDGNQYRKALISLDNFHKRAAGDVRARLNAR